MTKKVIKNVLCIAFVTFVVLGSIRVRKVNSESYVPVKYVEMGETLFYNGISFTPKSAELITEEEFDEEYSLNYSQITDGGDLIVLLKFTVRNESDKSMELSEMLSDIGYGFETHTWCSSTDPFLCSGINQYSSATVESGEAVEFYTGVGIDAGAFSEKGWENIYNTEFYYTMSVYPEPVKIHIGIPKNNH
jgi:hypothetical protein